MKAFLPAHRSICAVTPPIPLSRAFSQVADWLRIWVSNRLVSSPRVLSHGLQDPIRTLPDPIGFSDLCAPFPRSKTRQDSTLPRKCRAGSRAALVPLFPPRVRHAVGPYPKLGVSLLAVAPIVCSHSENFLWLTNQNPEPPNSPSISLSMPSCGLNRFTSRWDSGRKLKRSRPFYFVSTKDKIDPAALQRMEKKIDH